MNKPSLIWPLAVTIPSVVILLAMGFWQLERLAWKEGMITERQTALAAPPEQLPRAEMINDQMNFRRVHVSGHYLEGQDIHLQNRNHNGTRGVEIITLFERTSDEGSGIVLVNRGWVPLNRLDSFKQNNEASMSKQKVSGVVRMGVTGRNSFTPDNVPEKQLWYSPDPLAMARAAGFPTAALIIVIDRAGPAETFPISGLSHYELKNNHMSYALTWFSLAAGLLVIFGLFVRQRLREKA